jgi:hypothetical protein
MSEQKPEFEFSAFKDAFERKDAYRWVQLVLRRRCGVDRVQALRAPTRPAPHGRQKTHRGVHRFARKERHQDLPLQRGFGKRARRL